MSASRLRRAEAPPAPIETDAGPSLIYRRGDRWVTPIVPFHTAVLAVRAITTGIGLALSMPSFLEREWAVVGWCVLLLATAQAPR